MEKRADDDGLPNFTEDGERGLNRAVNEDPPEPRGGLEIVAFSLALRHRGEWLKMQAASVGAGDTAGFTAVERPGEVAPAAVPVRSA